MNWCHVLTHTGAFNLNIIYQRHGFQKKWFVKVVNRCDACCHFLKCLLICSGFRRVLSIYLKHVGPFSALLWCRKHPEQFILDSQIPNRLRHFSHCLSNAHQSFSETAAEVQDENHLKRGLSQQRSCWHGNGCLCEWRLLLRAWSEVSHCLMVQEDPVRLLYKFTKPGFRLIFYYFL